MNEKLKIVKALTTHRDAELVSCAFFDAGAEGVEIADRQDFIDLIKSDVIWDYVDNSVLEKSDVVTVSTTVDINNKSFTDSLINRLLEMRRDGGIEYGEITETVINAEDYENEWKKYYKPIKTDKITIVPSWIKYTPEENEKIMVLDPGMAFGTGEHATTRMCLELMDVENKSVIDVGCGSGILGIAAAICGAKSVYMCDIDADAIKFAKENACRNNVEADIAQADLLSGDKKADFIFANITADILMRLSENLSEHMNVGARAVISGIIDSRLDEVKTCFEKNGFRILSELSDGDWRALKLEKNNI